METPVKMLDLRNSILRQLQKRKGQNQPHQTAYFAAWNAHFAAWNASNCLA
jgi:hypothetical protein